VRKGALMDDRLFPLEIPNLIGGKARPAADGGSFAKVEPDRGTEICRVARSQAADVDAAVAAALAAQPSWADETPVKRGAVLHAVAMKLRERREDVARVVALETGKSFSSALGETDGAIALALFYAGEGQRLYARTTTSGVAGKSAMTVREPVGIAGLIIAANTPIANVAWKVFPALICGNAAIVKAADDTPATAWQP
jgi:alpha-ketoglutaric semialdehyde dehydrogenase